MSEHANIPDPVGFPAVLDGELDQIQERRTQVFPKISPTERSVPEREFERAHRMRPFGMGISGGGIRSATFNLGILQGLSERGLLPHLDYLSTVSGGGYIGSWLHGVIQRKHKGDPKAAADKLSPAKNPVPGEATHDPVSFLRKYSNYLAPRRGFFSADFWVIGAIWFRNMFLNQLILVPFLAAVLLFPLIAGFLQQRIWNPNSTSFTPQFLEEGIAAVFLLVAVCIAGLNVHAAAKREFDQPKSEGSPRKKPWTWSGPLCAACILVGSFLLVCAQMTPPIDPLIWGAGVCAVLFVLFFLLQWIAGFADCYLRRRPDATGADKALLIFHFLWMPLVCAGVTTGLLYGVSRVLDAWANDTAYGGTGSWHLIAWGTPIIVQVWIIGASLHIGLMGSDMLDASREWIARVGAELGMASFAWVALFAIAVFGPYWMSLLLLNLFGLGLTAIAGWIGTTVAGVFSGKSSKTGGQTENAPGGKTVLELIGKIAPGVFVVGLLLLISFGVHQAVAVVAHCWASPIHNFQPRQQASGNASSKTNAIEDLHDFTHHGASGVDTTVVVALVRDAVAKEPPTSGLQGFVQEYWYVLDDSIYKQPGTFSAAWWPTLGLFASCLVVTLVLSSRVNINEFSLHHFYKNRLVRCYLGASVADIRQPNPLTGFDPKDELPISRLRAIRRKPQHDAYLGPYAIVNTTLNLNRGSELAKQERKGSSFIFTPLFCGYDPPHSREDQEEYSKPGSSLREHGYRRTEGYAYPPDGPGIGTALAISGAAANPNAGYTTSAALAFLMTIFDVRLGWWVGNTRYDDAAKRPGPVLALRYLLTELFAQTDARTPFLNLSDGGHYENLGLYELVRRRCRYIVIGDGEQDGELNFGSLGGAIRKCRADFGVEIDIDPQRIRKVNGFSLTHCVVGKITYPKQDDPKSTGGAQGLLLYLKSSLTGDEPEDVIQYYSSNPDFPHQSTANQFFTESQFESYRQLGLHVVRTVFENVRGSVDGDSPGQIRDLFADLERKWYAPSSVGEGVATAHADAYTAIIKRVSDDKDLRFLDTRLFDKYSDLAAPPLSDDPDVLRKAKYICLDLIQLMENVYTDLHFRNRADRCNPSNGGWIQVFRYWTRQDIFQRTWLFARDTYNPLFREFYNDLAAGKDPCA